MSFTIQFLFNVKYTNMSRCACLKGTVQTGIKSIIKRIIVKKVYCVYLAQHIGITYFTK